MRAVRLAAVALAMSDRAVSLTWLRDELGLYQQANPESGRAQFERDKRDLRAAGVDIVEHDDRYRAVGSRRPAFSPAELDVLTAVAGLVADPATGAALGAFAGKADAYPDVRHDDRLRTGVPDTPVAEALLAAVDAATAVGFTYRRVEGPPRTYDVEPWAVRQRRGLWYVLAWDRRDAVAKHFRLDRVASAVTTTGEATTPRPDVLPAFDPPGVVGDVTVRLHGRGTFEALQLGAQPDLDLAPAATQTVTLPAVRDEVALAFALGHDAELLAPAPLAAERDRRLALVHDLHSLPAPLPPDAWEVDDDAAEALPPERIRRLLALPGWLDERVDVTLHEAARAFGVSEDELAEDLEVLREVTLPGHGDVVDTTVEPDGRITRQVAVTVPLQLDVLGRARVRSLVATARSVRADERAVTGLDRLADRLDGPVVAAVDAEDHLPLLTLLRDARDARRTVTFLHQARGSAEVRVRRLTPTRIDWADGHPYVGGWDHDRGEPRWFRLDRVARVETGDPDPVSREVELDAIRYVPRGEEVELVLRCTHVGSWVLQRTLPDRRVELPDGTVWAVVRTDSPDVVADHVVVAAGEAEIVAPASHRLAVVERAALRL